MQKLNRSFARRIGKTLSGIQKSLLSEQLPKYLFDPQNMPNKDRYIVEIGIGMGDHFVMRAAQNQDALHIGFEPYLNGIANSLKLMQEEDVHNVALWPNDMDMVFHQLPINILDAIYILFPDPWPKNRHHKRRLFNPERLKLFASKMKNNGKIYFATDIEDYFSQAKTIITKSSLFIKIISGDTPYEHYIQTKYHEKAIIEGRGVQFLYATKI